MADALRSGRSVLYGRVGSNPSLGTIFTTRACSSVDRALPCGGRGREFESRQARHFFACSARPAHGRLAQMVRASALHAEGRGFESLTAHQHFGPFDVELETAYGRDTATFLVNEQTGGHGGGLGFSRN